MDPIEKLLSELAPSRNSAALDETMRCVFARADRRARIRRAVRNSLMLGAMLVAGIGVGYSAGRSSTERSSGIPYSGPAESTSREAFFDYSNQGESVITGPVRMSVSIRPIVPANAADSEKGS